MIKHLLMMGAAAAVLGGCATTAAVSDYADTTPPEAKLYGDFLVGSYANNIDDAASRSEYYTRAYKQAKDDVNLASRAVRSAVATGDMKAAKGLAQDVLKDHNSEPFSRAVLGLKAFSAGRHEAAETYFEMTSQDLTVQILMNLMRGWNAAADKQPEKARSLFASLGGGGYFDLMGQLQTANLDVALGNIDDANAAFEKVETASLSPIETALSKTRALSVAGNVDLAREYIEKFSSDNGGFESGPVRVYMDALAAGEPILEKLSSKQEAARALTESSYGFFLRNRAADAAEIYLRFALELDPDHDKAKLWLGNLLENSKRSDEAMALYKSIKPASPYVMSGKLAQANIYFARDEDDTALALLEKANAEHTSFVTRESLGRARLIRENYKEALPIYDALVKSMSEDEIKNNTQPLYFRGICYERLKQWDNAVADFKRVLEIDPDNADALNYLGYTWVDRNENLEEAFKMIRRAVALEPGSGAIVDSLGWAHFKLGQYEAARVQLENAVSLSPSSATIIDHLGDVYWKIGRFREAGYQWKRALEFDPTDEEKAKIEAKLKGGLDAAEALP